MSSHLRKRRRKAASPVQLANQFIDVLGSLEYQSIYANKRVLDHLNVIENDIINKIIDTKSSKYLIDDYHEILNKKKKILQRNNTENSNPPSPENPKKSFKTPKSKFIKTKND